MNIAHPQVGPPVFRLLARALPLDSLSLPPLPTSLLSSFPSFLHTELFREQASGISWWSRTARSHCWGLGSVPCWGTKIPQAARHPPPPRKKKKKRSRHQLREHQYPQKINDEALVNGEFKRFPLILVHAMASFWVAAHFQVLLIAALWMALGGAELITNSFWFFRVKAAVSSSVLIQPRGWRIQGWV